MKADKNSESGVIHLMKEVDEKIAEYASLCGGFKSYLNLKFDADEVDLESEEVCQTCKRAYLSS